MATCKKLQGGKCANEPAASTQIHFILSFSNLLCDLKLKLRTMILFPETHTKRQATQHGYLPSLQGDGDKGIEIVCSEGKNNFELGRLEQ